MKRLGVAGLIRSDGFHSLHLLLGRRGKDPNRGLFVLPGGGVKDGESLEEAFCREVMEETGLEIFPSPFRWNKPNVIELSDRIILVAHATIKLGMNYDYQLDYEDSPRDGGDLYDVRWFPINNLPSDISPVVVPILSDWGFHPGKLSNFQFRK